MACLFTLWRTEVLNLKVTVTPLSTSSSMVCSVVVPCVRNPCSLQSQSPCFSGQHNTSLGVCSPPSYGFHCMPLGSTTTFPTQEFCVENLPRTAMLEEKHISSLHLNNNLVGYKILLLKLFWCWESILDPLLLLTSLILVCLFETFYFKKIWNFLYIFVVFNPSVSRRRLSSFHLSCLAFFKFQIFPLLWFLRNSSSL